MRVVVQFVNLSERVCKCMMPEFRTIMSILPKAASVLSNSACARAASETSAFTRNAALALFELSTSTTSLAAFSLLT